MMNLSAGLQTALDSQNITFAYLVDLPGPIRQTDWATDVSYNAQTYTSGGLLVRAQGTSVSEDIRVDNMVVTMTNVNQTVLSAYGATNYFGQPATIYLAIFDANDSLVGAITLFEGTFDTWTVSENTTESRIEVKITSHWAKHQRRAGRYTNDASQQELYPGDTFFDRGHEDKTEMRWGKKY